MELILSGISLAGVAERLGGSQIPQAILKYFFCSPNVDFSFRCLPSSGGMYSQRYRDILEFNIIEHKIRERRRRSGQ